MIETDCPRVFPNRSMALRGRACRGQLNHVHPKTGRRPILQTERRSVSVCSVCSVVQRRETGDDKKPGTVPSRWGSGMLALFPSLAACSIAKLNVLKGFAPSWKPLLRLLRHHPPEVALRLPPANGLDPSGIPVRTAARKGWPSRRVPQWLHPDRTDRTDRAESDRSARNQGQTPRVGQGRVFPKRRLLLNPPPQSLAASSRSSWFTFLSTIVLTYGPFNLPVNHCLSLSRDSSYALVLNPICLTEYFTQNLMDLACFCSKSQDKTTTNPQYCDPDEKPGTVPAR